MFVHTRIQYHDRIPSKQQFRRRLLFQNQSNLRVATVLTVSVRVFLAVRVVWMTSRSFDVTVYDWPAAEAVEDSDTKFRREILGKLRLRCFATVDNTRLLLSKRLHWAYKFSKTMKYEVVTDDLLCTVFK